MQSFYSFCCGADDEESRNKPVYKDGTFWTMLGVLVAAMVLTSLVSASGALMKYDKSADADLKRDLFFIPVPEWVIPLVWFGIYVLYFLGVYLMYRRINQNTDISADKRNRSKSYMWLLYIVVLVSNFLWSWAYLGAGEHTVAFLFLATMLAAVICQIVLTGSKGWGGSPTGAWWFFWPMIAYFALVAVPINFSSAFMSNGKHEEYNRTIRKSKGFNPLKSISKDLSSLAI